MDAAFILACGEQTRQSKSFPPRIRKPFAEIAADMNPQAGAGTAQNSPACPAGLILHSSAGDYCSFVTIILHPGSGWGLENQPRKTPPCRIETMVKKMSATTMKIKDGSIIRV